ncbi:MAG TPA: hypothetical protein VK179_14005 [Bacteroidales bacterium]|nr:hypothetical protein [Bacteroidales bacterium]
MKIRSLLILTLFIPSLINAQTESPSIFSTIEIRTDSGVYNSNKNSLMSGGEKLLYFFYREENEIAEITLTPKEPMTQLHLIPSGDYEIIDSLLLFNNAWHSKVRFKNLTQSRFLKLQVSYSTAETSGYQAIGLFPCTKTTVSIKPASDDLFLGEEKVFEIITNNAANLRFASEWTSGLPMDYRLENLNNQLILHVMPNQTGLQRLKLNLHTDKPDMDLNTNTPLSQLPPLECTFSVKTSRLQYLNTDKKDVTMDEKARTQGVEIQLDNSRNLQINKTYRVENQEEPGGVLIAEIFTRNYLTDNRVLCYLKTYNYHRSTEGYLYIKEGDEARFISNFNITPATAITAISVMRDGGEWSRDLSVYPGETVSVKIEGTALYKARFHFEDLVDITSDTLIQNEQQVIMRLRVPLDINKKRVGLYSNSANTGQALTIREYENPRPFDYIMLNYGDINRVVSGVRGPILFDKTIRDIVISFNENRIDVDDKLYGRQYVSVDLRVTGPANELIDMKTLPAMTVCPGENSPRYNYYDKRNCNQGDISLNKFLSRTTSDLDDWSKIHLTFRNTPGKYGEVQQEKEIDIILKKKMKFDIDVSFPAGLLTVSHDPENPGKTTFNNLYGISMAMVAQFAFYHPEKIAKLRPYRFGAGFLALDAFNFQSERQDLAIVALASLYPTSRGKKLAFPLYLGGGYQFKANTWMLLIGPGISVKL